MDEPVQVWKACGDDDRADRQADILAGKCRDQIATCARRRSTSPTVTSGCRASASRMATIPKAQDDLVPLTRQMPSVIDSAPRRANNDYPFGRSGFTGFSTSKATSTRRSLSRPGSYDLRLRSPPDRRRARGPADLVEALLNDIKKGLEGVDNKAEDMTQKRDAGPGWGEFLDVKLGVEPGNVAPMTSYA